MLTSLQGTSCTEIAATTRSSLRSISHSAIAFANWTMVAGIPATHSSSQVGGRYWGFSTRPLAPSLVATSRMVPNVHPAPVRSPTSTSLPATSSG